MLEVLKPSLAIDAKFIVDICMPGLRKRLAVVSSDPYQFLNTENIVNNKGQLLQDPFLNALRREHVPVSIYLVNGIKLQGQIESFDQYVVLLRNTVTQMVYKHAISTIVPGRAVNFASGEGGEPAAA